MVDLRTCVVCHTEVVMCHDSVPVEGEVLEETETENSCGGVEELSAN